MPRLALIADIHANLEALQAVLADIAAVRADEVVCLGDVVGYGPDPAACVEIVYDACSIALLGNHDKAALDEAAADRFNDHARASIDFTRRSLGRLHRSVLASFVRRAEAHGVALTHGTFARQPWEYISSTPAADRAFAGLPGSLGAFGHTHMPSLFWQPGDDASGADLAPDRPRGSSGRLLPAGVEVSLPADRRHLVNPGSVGQPRDRNPDAAWMLLDTGARTAVVRRVPYDVEAVHRKIRLAGLPDRLGERLRVGT